MGLWSSFTGAVSDAWDSATDWVEDKTDKLVDWATGHDNEKESLLYDNYEMVGVVCDEIKDIATTTVGEAQEQVYNALNELNAVNGMESILGITIPTESYDELFVQLGETVNGVAVSINDASEAIKIYEESPTWKKVTSSLTMGVCKFGEGLLSVVEDLGDGIVSVVGWGAGKMGFSDFQNDCAKFVQKEWSHDAFNFYYNSDFAKASVFTENSGISSGIKLAGKTVGYLYLGGAVSGAMGSAGGVVGKVVSAAGKVASSSTWGATAVGFVGGLGSGTEAALNAGQDFDSAFKTGLKTGGVQAGLAFAGGKLGEKLTKVAKVKGAQKAVDEADDALEAAQRAKDEIIAGGTKAGKPFKNPNMSSRVRAASDVVDDAANTLDKATADLANIKNMKLSQFEGYSDSITQAGQRFGRAGMDTVKTGVRALKDTAVASRGIRSGSLSGKGAYSATATESQAAFKESAKGLLKENPLVQGATTIKSGATKVGGAIAHPITTAKSVGSSAWSATKAVGKAPLHPIQTTKAVAGAVASVAKSPLTPTLAAAGVGSTINYGTQEVGKMIGDSRAAVNQVSVPTIPSTQHSYGSNQHFQLEQTSTEPIINYGSGGETSGGGTGGGYSGGGGGYSSGGGGYSSGGSSSGGSYTSTIAPITPNTGAKPTTASPTTAAPTTSHPTTAAPTTSHPTTAAPTTSHPTTAAPTTSHPTTAAPTTSHPTTAAPTTRAVSVVGGASGGGGGTGSGYGGGSGTGSSTNHSGTGYDDTVASDGSLAASIDNLFDDTGSSIDEIIKGSKYNRIPTSEKPLETSKSGGSSSIIPIATGLSAASAAGLGAKAYMDYKKNNSTEDDEEYDEYEEAYEDDDQFIADGWTEDADAETLDMSEDQEFINKDKTGDDEYYHVSESPLPIMGTEELEEF